MKQRTLLLTLALCLLPALALAAEPHPQNIDRPDLTPLFAERGLEGCFAVQHGGETIRVNPARAGQRFRPESTFKIVNALVALESGRASGPDFLIPWDGVERQFPAWNRDLTLEQAFRASAIWYFVELGKRNGRERLGAAMRALAYGNADASGSDQFWLDGPLRISADEQVRLLDRLSRGDVPFSVRNLGLLRQIMLMDKGPGWALYGKTGLTLKDVGDGQPFVGWFVGWVEQGGRVSPFALNISPEGGGKPGANFGSARMELARALLTRLGILPQKWNFPSAALEALPQGGAFFAASSPSPQDDRPAPAWKCCCAGETEHAGPLHSAQKGGVFHNGQTARRTQTGRQPCATSHPSPRLRTNWLRACATA